VVFRFDMARGQIYPKRDARVMSSAGGSATPHKIHNDDAERKCGTEGANGGHIHPRFSCYHISNIQCISVQQSSITL
jgi:hypothetical protein